MKFRWVLAASGFALLLALPSFAPLLFPGDVALFHHHRHLTTMLCGVLLAMLVISALGMGILALLHFGLSIKTRSIVGAAIAVLVILRAIGAAIEVVEHWRTSLNPQLHEAAPASDMLATVVHDWFQWPLKLALYSVFVLLAWRKPSITQPVVKTTGYALAALALCLVWITPQLLFLAFGLRPTPRVIPPEHPAMNKRIVWILFDELSYKQAFEQHVDGVELPNFRTLRSESVSFADLQPVGFFTDRIIPSVIGGKKIDNIESDAERKLIYLNPDQHRWVSYNQDDTLFGLAQSAGWNTGVVGWYIPYCRIFSNVLDSCSWEPDRLGGLPMESLGASEDKSTLANAGILLSAFLSERSPTPQELLAPRLPVYSRLMTRAEDLIRNDRIDFVFIHFSVPHPPGFFDRRTHKLCTCGNYFDNLVLADDSLGEMLHALQQTKLADQTTLIVSSDHSWRVSMWRGETFWTGEEERISQGQFDTRPVFLVHFPAQKEEIDVKEPQRELTEHEIIAAMLQNKIDSAGDLVSFLHRAEPSEEALKPVPAKP